MNKHRTFRSVDYLIPLIVDDTTKEVDGYGNLLYS